MANKKPKVDEFAKHELMDRAYYVLEILELIETHPAHDKATRKAHKKAVAGVYKLYAATANMRFEE
jgi:hypothetical protein